MISHSSLPRSTRGFTMVELLVVIAIMGILAALAAPSVNTFLSKQRIKSAAYDLAQTLQTARSSAILSRRSVDVRASYPNASIGGKWNGTKTSILYDTDVTTADKASIANTSFYVFESGSGASSAGTTDNRVTKFSTLNNNVIVTADPVLVRFTPDSGVQTSLSTSSPTPVNVTADVTFVVTYTGSSDPGYTITLNRFGGTQVKKN